MSKRISQPRSNPDETSPFVIVSLDYDPNEPINSDLNQRGYKERRYRNVIMDDTGEYTFTNEDLRGMPKNGVLATEIYRGNFIKTSDQNSKLDFLLGSYSMIAYFTTNR
jgi:hypothetical protein